MTCSQDEELLRTYSSDGYAPESQAPRESGRLHCSLVEAAGQVFEIDLERTEHIETSETS
jgi:hypothetical protein